MAFKPFAVGAAFAAVALFARPATADLIPRGPTVCVSYALCSIRQAAKFADHRAVSYTALPFLVSLSQRTTNPLATSTACKELIPVLQVQAPFTMTHLLCACAGIPMTTLNVVRMIFLGGLILLITTLFHSICKPRSQLTLEQKHAYEVPFSSPTMGH